MRHRRVRVRGDLPMPRHRAGGRPNWQGQVGQILDGDGGYIPGEATARDHLVRHVSKGTYGRTYATVTRRRLEAI
jgi:hypothetical protein